MDILVDDIVDLVLTYLDLPLVLRLVQALGPHHPRSQWIRHRRHTLIIGGDDANLIPPSQCQYYLATFLNLDVRWHGSGAAALAELSGYSDHIRSCELVIDNHWRHPPPHTVHKVTKFFLRLIDIGGDLGVIGHYPNLAHLRLHDLRLGPFAFPCHLVLRQLRLENCVLTLLVLPPHLEEFTVILSVFTTPMAAPQQLQSLFVSNCDHDGPDGVDYHLQFLLDVCVNSYATLRHYLVYDAHTELMVLSMSERDPMVAVCKVIAATLASAPSIIQVRLAEPASAFIDDQTLKHRYQENMAQLAMI